LFEIFLAFHSWYKSEDPIKWDAMSRTTIQQSIITMITKVKNVLPRNNGYSWRLQKFHELLHIPFDVENFGSPKNFDTGIMENRLIHVGKINAKHTQKRGCKIFTQQLANRIHEQQCYQKTKRCLNIDDDMNSISSNNSDVSLINHTQHADRILRNHNPAMNNIHNQETHYQKLKCDYVVKTSLRHKVTCRWKTRTQTYVPDVILNGFLEVMVEHHLNTLDVFTEVNHKGNKFRAHPHYRGTGAWYDWAMIRFQPSDTDRQRDRDNRRRGTIAAYPMSFYPAKLLGFFSLNGEIHCLFQTTITKESSENDSCLTERWNLEYHEVRTRLPRGATAQQRRATPAEFCPTIRYCSIHCLEESVYVVQEDPGLYGHMGEDSTVVVLVKKKPSWKIFFTDNF
jgi:hypothetical protein